MALPALALAVASAAFVAPGHAQRGRVATPLGPGPWVYDTFEPKTRITVSVVTRGLVRPWSLAWLPTGEMLVTERPGRLRIIRDGVLDPTPLSGVPAVVSNGLSGLMDVSLHPRFSENRLVYLTYSTKADYGVTTAISRGRLDGHTLADVEEIFVGDSSGKGNAGGASRLAWGADGTLFMTMGGAGAVGDNRAQDGNSHKGKILRLTDEGRAPADNPFVGRAGYRPEIYSLGHRNQIGLAVNPSTGALWATEQGPQGGDEANIILPGKNYGWPIVTYGRNYDGTLAAKQPWREDFEAPQLFWVPSIATSGLAFYTGDAIPSWEGNLFVGAMIEARVAGTGHLQRVVFNQNGEVRREALLRDLKQRIRDVRQGPDGLLYLLTDEDEGVVLRIEPAQ
jgi:glucose/arabinose dehydrogenase